MRDKTIAGFLDELGAKQPTPGGGAVSALNGAIAAAQLKMICEYTKDTAVTGKTGFLSQKIEQFVGLAEADSEAFANVSEAYKSKEPEKIKLSLISALSPSTKIIENCEELLSFCEEDYQKFNEKLQADLITSLANLKAAIRSSMAMISTNLEALGKDAPHDASSSKTTGRGMLARVDKIYEKLGA